MLTSTRPWLFGLTVGFLLAAGLFSILGPGLPALAQSGRAQAIAPPLETFRANGRLLVEPGTSEDRVDLTPPVPAGKLLVVEAVYATVAVTIGQLAVVGVGPSLADPVALPLVFQGTGASGDVYVTSVTSTRLYVPAGPVLGTIGKFDAGATALGIFAVVGHLVPAS